MEVKVITVVMSHLSDVQAIGKTEMINFCKWLLLKYKDTSVSIDPELEYEKFKERFLNR